MLQIRMLPVFVLLALASTAVAQEAERFTTGALSAGRNQTLVCNAIRQHDGTIELVIPHDGTPIASVDCGPNQCEVRHQHRSPVPLEAYCLLTRTAAVTPPTLALRLNDSNGVTLVSQDAIAPRK